MRLPGQWRAAEPPGGDPERPEYRRGLRLSRRSLLGRGLASVLIVPGQAVWPVGGFGVRLNDAIAPNGVFLPSSNMTITVASGLNNGTTGQSCASATCTGVNPAQATWFFLSPDNVSTIYGGPQSLFTLAPVTGQSVAAAALSAPNLLAARPEGHTVTLGVTDGLKTCLATCNIPCAWIVPTIPNIFVGRGMLAAHGSGIGYEHFSDLLSRLSGNGAPLEASLRGTTVIWMPDSDRDYYAGDCAAGENGFAQNYGTRFGIPGPIKFAAASQTGPRVRVGGLWGSASGGGDMATKGFFNVATGDFDMRGFEVAFCNGPGSPDTDASHGISGVRVNADKTGDFTAVNCAFHNNNNGVEAGEGPMKITIRNCIAFNNGGQTVGGGQTHAFYLGGSYLDFQNNVSYNNCVGHCLKARALKGVIMNNVLADGLNGSASQQLNIPQGGDYVIQGNTFQKGSSPQNPYCFGWNEDNYQLDRPMSLTLKNNTFVVIGAPGTRTGTPTGIQYFPRASTATLAPGQANTQTVGAAPQIIADGNAWYFKGAAQKLRLSLDANTVPAGNGQTITPLVETNATTLALPPPISFADPGTANPPAAAPGFYNWLQYYGDDIVNMTGVQIHSSNADIRIPAAGSAGALLTTLTAFGSQFYVNDSPTDARINPFAGAGNVWSFTSAPEYFGSAADWADNARFVLPAASGGLSAALRVGGVDLAPGVYRVKVRITSAAGAVADWRLYVVVTP